MWAPDYVTAADLRGYVGIDDDADDVELALACSGASRAVDEACHRQFGSTALQTRTYTPQWSKTRGALVVPIDDVMNVTGMVVALDTGSDLTFGTSVPAAEYRLGPLNADLDGRPWEELTLVSSLTIGLAPGGYGSVRVTATWGWSAVPETVKLATKLQASRFFARRISPFGVAGSPSDGSEVRLLARVDPDVAVALKSYIRRTWTR